MPRTFRRPRSLTFSGRFARLVAACLLVVAAGIASAQGHADGTEDPASNGAEGPARDLWTVESAEFITLPAAPVTLAAYAGGAAALLQDGRLMNTGPVGPRTLYRGLDGEVLVACGGRLLAVDGLGRLVGVPGAPGQGDTGPPVSLHATPACLSDGSVVTVDPNGRALLHLSPTLELLTRTPLALLPDAAPTVLPGDLVLVPTEPTLLYRHGVLGDEVEAAGAAVVDPTSGTVLSRWSVPGARVIEERRLVAVPGAGRFGAVATVSGEGDGGALVVLAATADAGLAWRPIAVAAGLGQEQGQRWRHVLGSVGRRLYSVATPHLGGPLERWTVPEDGGVLEREAFELPVTSHLLGSRETDFGRLVPRHASDDSASDLLVLPSRDLRALHLIACDPEGCVVAASLQLAAAAITAPLVQRTADDGVEVTIGLADGSLVRAAFLRHAHEGDPE